MPHLALNTTLPQVMRMKYQVAIGVAPIGLMFASFGPGFLFASWLANELGIPPDSPLTSQAYGTYWFIGFTLSMITLMIVGYALGWLVNQAFARWLLGWSPEKVRAVFARSEVPSHWLKPGAGTSSDPGGRSIAKWEQQRKIGLIKFVLIRGVLAWGMPMFIAMYAAPTLFSNRPFTASTLAFNIMLWVAAGGVFGALMWYFSEANYRKLKGRE